MQKEKKLRLGFEPQKIRLLGRPTLRLSYFSGHLMNFPKRSQAYLIACGPCLTPMGGWAGWHGWLGCREYKKLGHYLSKCPGTRLAF